MQRSLRFLTVLGAVALTGVVALLGSGCDDTSSSTTTPDTASTADTAAGNDTTGTDDAAAGSDAAVSTPVDQCQNSTDLAWLKSTVTTETGNMTGRELAREAAGDCGLGCLAYKDKAGECAIQCMKEDKGVQLSDACADCYGGIVLCTINKCLPKCIDDPQAQICKDCQDQKGCNDVFYGCTGNLD